MVIVEVVCGCRGERCKRKAECAFHLQTGSCPFVPALSPFPSTHFPTSIVEIIKVLSHQDPLTYPCNGAMQLGQIDSE